MMKIMDKMASSYWTLPTTALKILHQVKSFQQTCTAVPAAPKFEYPIIQI